MMRKLSEFEQAYQESAKTMNHEQFNSIVKAILEGRYSWACVLILRFAGYNPAHYIPYRTYKRLIKENRQRHLTEQTSRELMSEQSTPKEQQCGFSPMHLGETAFVSKAKK